MLCDKSQLPRHSPLLTHPPAGCWSSVLAWLQISWVTGLFPGQEWEESAGSGRWLQLLCWLPIEAFQTDWDPALSNRWECCFKSGTCRSLTVKHGSWVYFSVLGKPFSGDGVCSARHCELLLRHHPTCTNEHHWFWFLTVFATWSCSQDLSLCC